MTLQDPLVHGPTKRPHRASSQLMCVTTGAETPLDAASVRTLGAPTPPVQSRERETQGVHEQPVDPMGGPEP